MQEADLDVVPKQRGVFNADPYRDERGRFATAMGATLEALEATRKTDAIRIPGVVDRLESMEELSHREGDRETHSNLGNQHNVLAIAHEQSAQHWPYATLEHQRYMRAAELHRAAAAEQHLTRDRMLQIIIAHRNPGFDLSDNTQRLVYADWLEENHRDPKIGAAAADHLRKYSY